MTFYSNKTLAKRFQINLSKWKRWSREFLSPDPLGGYQSGYARQYSLKEAFVVFLGGHLVKGLGFSIADARQIISDLNEWLEDNGFYTHNIKDEWTDPITPSAFSDPKEMRIHILKVKGASEFVYRVRTTLSCEVLKEGPPSVVEERYEDQVLGSKKQSSLWAERSCRVKILMISRCYHFFLMALLGG